MSEQHQENDMENPEEHDPVLEALLEDVLTATTLDPDLLLRYHRSPGSLSDHERAEVEAALRQSANSRAQLELLRRFDADRASRRTSGSNAQSHSKLVTHVRTRAPRRSRSLTWAMSGLAAAAVVCAWLWIPSGGDSKRALDPPARAIDLAPSEAGLELIVLSPRRGAATRSRQPNLYWQTLGESGSEEAEAVAVFELRAADGDRIAMHRFAPDPSQRLQKISFSELGIELQAGRRYSFALWLAPAEAPEANPAPERRYEIRYLPSGEQTAPGPGSEPEISNEWFDEVDRVVAASAADDASVQAAADGRNPPLRRLLERAEIPLPETNP